MSFLKIAGKASLMSHASTEALADGGNLSLIEEGEVDLELSQCLKELCLDDYKENFGLLNVIYSDLPTLESETIVELIPDNIPRKRFIRFIKINFLQERKINNGWEIDPSKVTVHESEVIKTGGFGRVVKGEIAVGNGSIDVACKRIPVDGVEITREAIINEVKVMSLCRHPNILRCYGAYFTGKVATICLELIEHGDLLDFSDEHEIPRRLKINYLIEIARGLEYLHSKGIVHRDIKSTNILVGNDKKTLKICDFGTSKLSKTVQGTLVGTPVYLSPEVLFGDENVKPEKIDIYSLGILMWELLSDEQAFYSLQKKYQKDPMKFLMTVHGTPSKRKKIRPNLEHPKLKGLSSDILRLIDLCWESDFELRPSAETVLAVLMKVEKEIARNEDSDDE